eukprot:scaffold61381_cov33-Tisochrysis_lutea.AAC.3
MDTNGEVDEVVLPNEVLPQVHYLHDCFPPQLLDRLERLREQTMGDRCSVNMVALRRRFVSAELAEQITTSLPRQLAGLRVCAEMRFIEYSLGGYIAPHTDGPTFDQTAHASSTHTMLLYLRDVDDGGATCFLRSLDETTRPLAAVQPRAGSILIFPHGTPHMGEACGTQPKMLLRGDLVLSPPVADDEAAAQPPLRLSDSTRLGEGVTKETETILRNEHVPSGGCERVGNLSRTEV